MDPITYLKINLISLANLSKINNCEIKYKYIYYLAYT